MSEADTTARPDSLDYRRMGVASPVRASKGAATPMRPQDRGFPLLRLGAIFRSHEEDIRRANTRLPEPGLPFAESQPDKKYRRHAGPAVHDDGQHDFEHLDHNG